MKETYKKSLGREVQRRRKELGITQQQLAERTELHRTYISDIERGERNLSLESLYRISKGLSALPSRLLADAEHEANLAAGGDH